MNKSELMDAVFERRTTGFSKCHVEKAVNDALDIIAEQLAKSDKVVITGFGSFEAVTTAPRLGRNPHNGEAVQIPAGKKIKFKPGKALKEAVK
ncbi:MAG: HU family DNA-binding protein [Pseudodesulfovibrio sp.]|uniref:Histone family protein DNA-binding protein n=1 Tax=Pseudodesulfovibrio aespoeensis (strain ATCC 700646 / DSM 10631 / Aspo-2) TaxID=643562 RepID=E6VUC9_PSEA9|nr:MULTISPECIES: HU family DNA-binding protein [Pseudodesulfovibrio]MBU4192237.1 HU family DNA-binding protein [Pseudomonadota bacterium]ADU63436.1 histone family protein DNA-binding protein [Pseudodesulfovibrio aespoeensis Aspo-2]MBU4243483.1 HU family DNA-binding protein [Pseudomonadota bacterium]MBU4380254.1 HU family DNA-binding protein [Pseudomonadota bacterium]MBU4473817.1 HU family DNA-binding protein [Pseudomonadota bacterium]